MKFPVLEMFCSIQGEGKWTGVPSVFIRLAGCNLRCVFGQSRCDTPYSSFELEKPKWTSTEEAKQQLMKILKENPNVDNIVITGGEPLLYRDSIKEFIEKIETPNKSYTYTIETNGTLKAIEPWTGPNGWMYWIDLWSVSPKLSTSVDWDCKYINEKQRDAHNEMRINVDNLCTYIDATFLAQDATLKLYMPQSESTNVLPGVQYKFVYSGPDSVDEIKNILDRIAKKYNYSRKKLDQLVMLMPEGTTNDQLGNIQEECAQVCIREGWRFCDRLHIRIWGDKREV